MQNLWSLNVHTGTLNKHLPAQSSCHVWVYWALAVLRHQQVYNLRQAGGYKAWLRSFLPWRGRSHALRIDQIMDKTEHYETFHITYRDENDGDLSTNGERKKKTYSRDYKKSLAFRAVVTLYTQGENRTTYFAHRLPSPFSLWAR